MGKIIKSIKDWLDRSEVNKDLRYNHREIEKHKDITVFLKKEIYAIERYLSFLKLKLRECESLSERLGNWKNTLNNFKFNRKI